MEKTNTQGPMKLEEFLKLSAEEQRRLYIEARDTIFHRRGTVDLEDLVSLNALKIAFGFGNERRYDEAVTESTLRILIEKQKQGKFRWDQAAQISRQRLVTVDRIRDEGISGSILYGRGQIFIATHILEGKPVAHTIFNYFKDPKRRKHAERGQEYAKKVIEFANKTESDPQYMELLKKLEMISIIQRRETSRKPFPRHSTGYAQIAERQRRGSQVRTPEGQEQTGHNARMLCRSI
jgi:hypothetical protein